MTERVGRAAQYEAFADEFAAHAADGLYNAHLDRPACLALLGDVGGRDVLDAACGPGWYAAELAARGARVTALDQSPRMVELTAQIAPAATTRVHDLNDPLDWLPDASVDLVLLALAIEYLDDRVGALRELRRVLRPGGALVLSRLHPTADWLHNGGSYFDVRILEETWSQGWQLRYWLAPLEQTCDELCEAGFLIERLREPRPTAAAAALDPEVSARLNREPSFLALRAVPR